MHDENYQTNRMPKRLISLRELRQVFYEWVRKLLPIGNNFKDLQPDFQQSEAGNAEAAERDAEFLGWQKTKNSEAYALYTVTARQHPLYQSTVSERTLRKQQLDIPPTPPPDGPLMRFDYE
jgi:hypothetical protein